jgi:hypothetical protein
MRYFKPPFSEASIKKQYKELAKKHHPDKNGSEEDFKKMQLEYNEILEIKSALPVKKKKVYKKAQPRKVIIHKYILIDLKDIFKFLQ